MDVHLGTDECKGAEEVHVAAQLVEGRLPDCGHLVLDDHPVVTLPSLTVVGEAAHEVSSAEATPVRWAPVEDRQAICRSDVATGDVMGIFAPGYTMHQYREWLLTTVANILDDDLSISSAGLLRGGAIAWLEVSVPESITTPEGVTFRPNLLATPFDGSIATTFKRTVTDTVCDNTREAALAEEGQAYKVKHSRYSHAKLADARAALEMVHTIADDFANEVAQLCATPVTGQQWGRFLDLQVPRTDTSGQPLTGRAMAMTDRKRDVLNRLYRHGQRVAPWAGTAHGVVQAVNTYVHHEGIIRGAQRSERNMLRTVTGEFGRLDRTHRQHPAPGLELNEPSGGGLRAAPTGSFRT